MVAVCFWGMQLQIARRREMVDWRWQWVADGGGVFLGNAIAIMVGSRWQGVADGGALLLGNAMPCSGRLKEAVGCMEQGWPSFGKARGPLMATYAHVCPCLDTQIPEDHQNHKARMENQHRSPKNSKYNPLRTIAKSKTTVGNQKNQQRATEKDLPAHLLHQVRLCRTPAAIGRSGSGRVCLVFPLSTVWLV